jgi:aminocarboxymuconate-semialdehyde decarboxylase
MKTIDVHAHAFPAAYLEELASSPGPVTAERSGDAYDLWVGGRHFVRLGPEFVDLDLRLPAMDAAGVDVQVVSLGPPFLEWVSREEAVEMARLVNDHLVSLSDRSDGRFLPAAALPLQRPDALVEELRRAGDTGHRMAILPTRSGDVELDDPALVELFQEAERLGMGLFVHPIGRPGTEYMNPYRLEISIGFTTETTVAAARLLLAGYLDRFPGLKLCLAHLGGSLLWLGSRVEMIRGLLPGASSVTEATMADLMGRLYYDTMVLDPGQIRYAIERVGASQLLFGTDTPYLDDQTEAVKGVVCAACRGDECAALLSGNAERFLLSS